jgi:hypothetical protein
MFRKHIQNAARVEGKVFGLQNRRVKDQSHHAAVG